MKKRTADRVSIYPFFEECGKYTLDSFWRERFTLLANNIFPDGLSYDSKGKFIITNDDNSTKSIVLPKKAPDAFKKIVEILKNDFNIFSGREMSSKQGKETLEKHEEELNCEFKNIKPRNIKDQLIMSYASKLKIEYKLTNAEFSNLLSTIQLGFQFKALSSKNVDYKDGEIKNIEGLEFSKSKRIFTVPNTTIQNIRNEKTQNSDKFETSVKKYLKNNEARFAKFVD